MPPQEDRPLPGEDKNLIMPMSLPILGGMVLHGSEVPQSIGIQLTRGNDLSIMLETDSRAEANALFAALREGGRVDMPMEMAFWGDFFGSLKERFGVLRILVCSSTE